ELVDGPNLGADLQPVPEPTVRDLSIPQTKGGKPKGKGNPFEAPAEVHPEVEGEVISAKEIAAATKDEVLGTTDKNEKPAAKSGEESEGEAAALQAAAMPPKPRIITKKNKPIAVASTPLIGNYQLPPHTLLNHPDPSVKPT